MDIKEVRDRAGPSAAPITLAIGLVGSAKDSSAEANALARVLTEAVSRLGPEAAGTEIRIARPLEPDPTGEVELIPVLGASEPAVLVYIVTGGGGLWLRAVLLKWIAERKKKLDIHLRLRDGREITIEATLTEKALVQAMSRILKIAEEDEGGEMGQGPG